MNLIFDFDGTVADSIDENIRAINKFLRRFKRKETDKKEIRNGGLKALIESRNIQTWQILVLIYFGHKEIEKFIGEIKSFPGLPQVLRKLALKHKLGIITSNSKKNVEIFLKKNNLEDVFEFVAADRTITKKEKKLQKTMSKYKLEPQKTVLIGDETRDILSAKKAKLKTIAVSWGFESTASLSKTKPDKVAKKPEELLALLNS